MHRQASQLNSDELGFEEEPVSTCLWEKVQMVLGFEPAFTIDRSIPFTSPRHISFQTAIKSVIFSTVLLRKTINN